MKKLITISFMSISLSASASVSLDKLAGSWSSFCTQSQVAGKQGYLIETYSFTKASDFKLERQWFKDVKCTIKTELDTESGSIVIGEENTNGGFNPAGTFEAQYKTQKGIELGLLWVNGDYTKLRVARGFGQSQNTMLGIFEYKKQ